MDIRQLPTQVLPLNKLVPNTGQITDVPKNPRLIRDERFKQLCKSLKEDDLTGVEPCKVVPYGDKYVVLGGNMRYRALKEIGAKDVSCIVVPEDTPAKVLRKIVQIDNSQFGEYDWDLIANEWDEVELADWGLELPNDLGGNNESESESESEIERKEREFRERMAAGEISEEDEEYQEFLEKFKLKKTTDDCYTPAVVYDAVADYVAKTYGVKRRDFVRPFYPGGDYQREQYPGGCVVVDNPPFSILAEIMQFYAENKIPFFLFAPSLTLFSSSSSSNACAIPCGVGITYENGANVNTSFVTSFESDTIRVKTCPELYRVVKSANDKNLAEMHKELPKYNYPLSVVTSASLHPYSRLGIEFVIPKNESVAISQLDAQKETGKVIFGKGYLISDRLKAEREKAEREKAEREKAYVFELSDKERAIIAKLNK